MTRRLDLPPERRLDEITRYHTTASTFRELYGDANYRPSLRVYTNPELRLLADAYDLAMIDAGTTRRAYRSSVGRDEFIATQVAAIRTYVDRLDHEMFIACGETLRMYFLGDWNSPREILSPEEATQHLLMRRGPVRAERIWRIGREIERQGLHLAFEGSEAWHQLLFLRTTSAERGWQLSKHPRLVDENWPKMRAGDFIHRDAQLNLEG